MKRNAIKYLIIVFILFFTTSCREVNNLMSLNEFKDYSFQGVKPTVVDNVPEGYVYLNDVSTQYGDLITTGFFESQIYVLDLDGNNIKQTSISDSNFLVQHKNDLYVNESEIKELMPLAEQAFERRNKIYNIGESIDTYTAFSDPATVTVNEVSYAENYEDLSLQSDEWVCIITIDIEDGYDESFKEYAEKYNAVWKYFSHAETADGQKYTDVFEVDSSEIIFKLPKGVKAKYLYIQSPSTRITLRKVDISQ